MLFLSVGCHITVEPFVWPARFSTISMRDSRALRRSGHRSTVASDCGFRPRIVFGGFETLRRSSIAGPVVLSNAGRLAGTGFPQRERVNHPLFDRLDAIVRHAEGRLYPAKDAHMSGADFRRAYPAWERIEALRDPALCSRFWKRVTQI